MKEKNFFKILFLVLTIFVFNVPLISAASTAQVKDAPYESKWLSGVYPSVKLKNSAAESLINEAIRAEVDGFARKLRSDYWLHRDQIGSISYRVTCNKSDALSVILDESYTRNEGKIKKRWAKALTFRLSDGKRINYDDVWRIVDALGKSDKYDQAGLTEKLFEQTRRAGVALFDVFPGTPYPPEDIYLDEKLRFHAIFQPGIVAEEATGPIDIDIDEEYW